MSYENGGNSKSYAEITMDADLAQAFTKKTVVVGTTTDGVEVRGKLYENAAANQKIVKVQYDTSEDQSNWVGCRVGGLQESDGSGSLEVSGCFKENGSVTIGDATDLDYSYNQLENNKNGRTIKGFSTAVQAKMLDCEPGCPMKNPEIFDAYYGEPDYGDIWVTAAFDKTATSFTRGNADFSDSSVTGFVGRREAIKKGTVYLHIFMYVIREFEDAVIDCKTECEVESNCNDDPVHAWDEGVAFYTGSLEGADGVASGKMLHQLADKRCANFGTCGADGSAYEGTSFVNIELLKLFKKGRDQLRKGECGLTKTTMNDIFTLMYVPMVQGSLRYAYKVGVLEAGEKEKLEGATFVAGVLPRIHDADADAAATIYENQKVGAASTDHSAVKEAFESVYSDLGITCEHIGGLLKSDNVDYEVGAEPCVDRSSKSASSVLSVVMPMVFTLVVSMIV